MTRGPAFRAAWMGTGLGKTGAPGSTVTRRVFRCSRYSRVGVGTNDTGMAALSLSKVASIVFMCGLLLPSLGWDGKLIIGVWERAGLSVFREGSGDPRAFPPGFLFTSHAPRPASSTA